jgi:hypothetical protein
MDAEVAMSSTVTLRSERGSSPAIHLRKRRISRNGRQLSEQLTGSCPRCLFRGFPDVLGKKKATSSWPEAVESCSSPEWEDLCLEAANQYRERLIERSLARYAKWNDVVLAIKPLTQALVREKTKDVIARNNLPEVFLQTVDCDILHLCMEAEYADVFPPGFYASQAYWYVKGHFPCGWRGAFPQGRLVIY